MTNRNELERLLAAAKGRNNADQVALANHMTDNAHHYLSLMDEVERLRGIIWKIEQATRTNRDAGVRIAKIQDLTAQALGETHDN